MIDYTYLNGIIDDLGVNVTVNTLNVTGIDAYGKETINKTNSTRKMLVQKYVEGTHKLIGDNLEGVPELIAYTNSEVDIKNTITLKGIEYKIIDLYYQPISDSYLYYKLALKRL